MYDQDQATLMMATQTVLLPALFALVALVGGWLLQSRQRGGAAIAVLSLGVALGFWVCASWIRGRWGLPPRQAMDVLVAAPLLLVAGEVAQQQRWRHGGWQLLLLALLVPLVWMLWPILSRRELLAAAAPVVVIALLSVLVYGVSQRPSVRDQSNAFWLGCAAFAAPLMALDGSLLLAQLGGVLASMLGVVWLLSLLGRSVDLQLSLLPGVMVVLLYSAAYFYANADPLALLLPALLLLLALALQWRWPSRGALLASLRLLALGGLGLAVSLWLIWPQESMY